MPQIYQFTAADPYEAMQAGMEQARKNRLGDIDVAEKARAFEASKALNELYNKLVDPVTGQIDRNRLYGGMAARGYGGMIPGLQTAQAELEAKQAKSLRDIAESGKVTGETIQNRVKHWRDLIPSDPSMAPNWVAGMYSDPLVAPMLNKVGTLDQVIKSIPKDPAEYQKWAQKWSMGAEEFNKAMMPYVTPKSKEVMEQELAKAAAGKTSINVPINTSKKFGETLAEGAGKRLDSFRDNAEQAVRAIETNKRLRPLLDDPKFISGTFADARTAVARALGMDVSTTESFFSGMAEQVASRIKAFGSGSGLSNADREYALAWAGGKPDLSAAGIAKIMKINDQSAKYAVKKYNEERKFLGKKEPEVFNYYPEISGETASNEGRTVVRTGTDTVTGKKVVQYSDGTTEYAP